MSFYILNEHDFNVTMVGWVNVRDSDQGDYRCRHAIDISSWNKISLC